MGSGVHTSCVVRNTRHLAESLGVELPVSSIVEIPNLPINFTYSPR